MKYSPVPISKPVAETPELAQGETTENPRPAPNANKTNVNAQEATAPATTAAHETPALDGSSTSSTTSPNSSMTPAGRITCSIKILPAFLNSMTWKCWNVKKVPPSGRDLMSRPYRRNAPRVSLHFMAFL